MSSCENQIGYGKPPVHCRFKKGQSGNPKGRPKGIKNLKTDLNEELQERILVREGSRAIKVSKQRAIVMSLIARTLKGDARAATTLTNMMYRVLDLASEAAAEESLDADEREILATLEEELRRKVLQAANTEQSPKRDGDKS